MRPSRLNLAVGGLPVSLERRSGSFGPETVRRYGAFLTGAKPRYRLDLEVSGGRVSGYAWDPVVAARNGSLGCRSSEFVWSLDRENRRGRGRLRDTPRNLESLLRVLYATLAPLERGVLLHAAAFSWRGEAFLFAGPSGAGKTTLIRRLRGAPGVQALSDELVFVRRGGGGFELCATPFWGVFRRPEGNGRAPLKKIFLLGRSRSGIERAPLPAGEAQRRLMRCVVNFGGSNAALERSWDLILDMIGRSSVEEFRWRKDVPAAGILRSLR